MNLCKYKDYLGKPKEGFHETRIPLLNIALYDTLATFVLSVIISLIIYYFNKSNFLKIFLKTTAILFILGIILHGIFCVNTTINNKLFGNDS